MPRRHAESNALNWLLPFIRVPLPMSEDNVSGRISDERFALMRKTYADKSAELKELIRILRDKIDRQGQQMDNLDRFIQKAGKYNVRVSHDFVGYIPPDKLMGQDFKVLHGGPLQHYCRVSFCASAGSVRPRKLLESHENHRWKCLETPHWKIGFPLRNTGLIFPEFSFRMNLIGL